MTRNEFLKWMGGAALATLAVACKSDNDKTPDAKEIDAPAGCTTSNAKIMIADNHTHAPHDVVVSKEDVAAAVDKTYSIQGAASHDHMITITAAQFMMLQQGGSIMVTSTEGLGHTHVVTVSC
ncbi:MAG TPA: hypothetical protein VL326_28595 [Kofleriaceae bacterium]|jgi:hypothetical protein|nr:hypothetical protein [Kofleriaceae bacterium]